VVINLAEKGRPKIVPEVILGMSLCQGDSGGGLVVKFENRYHIAAVASLGVLSETGGGECDSSQYNVYTLFADYIDFVSDKLTQYPP
jgi:secreted trypsin-like serine protease